MTELCACACVCMPNLSSNRTKNNETTKTAREGSHLPAPHPNLFYTRYSLWANVKACENFQIYSSIGLKCGLW